MNNLHRPNHYQKHLPGEYFVTGRIINSIPLLNTNERKELFFDVLINLVNDHGSDLVAWVILHEHYHLVIYSENAFTFRRFITRLHSITATLLNREDECSGRKIWYQYWDRRIRNEEDFWRHVNYCHYNPIKHGVIKDLKDQKLDQYCSYGIWETVFSTEALDLFYTFYPIDDFDPFVR
ncbi:MAG: transposase [Candidatus Uhrbacteria bacterium]|nr:transposase [Patescibacteria group bacterium]MBU1906934.1 transposase [Patescibacteria group bacterium]